MPISTGEKVNNLQKRQNIALEESKHDVFYQDLYYSVPPNSNIEIIDSTFFIIMDELNSLKENFNSNKFQEASDILMYAYNIEIPSISLMYHFMNLIIQENMDKLPPLLMKIINKSPLRYRINNYKNLYVSPNLL